MRTSTFAALGVALLLGTIAPSSASAGGLEFPAPGTRGLARQGAFHARPDSPLALLYNPANLAALPGIQLSLQANLAFYEACYQRTGTYGADGNGVDRVPGYDPTFDTSAFGELPLNDSLPEVCNSGPPGVVPELVFTWRVHRMVGIGLGFVAPSAVGHTVWGDDVRVGDRTYRGVTAGQPSPSRYNLVEEQLLIAFPTIGVGIAPHPRVRIGAAFGSGFGRFTFDNVVRATTGEIPDGDVFAHLEASDPFIPRVTGSVQVVPHDNLDIMAGFTWTQAVNADADTTLQSTYYSADGITEELTLPGGTLDAPQPWSVSFGIRYADRISARPVDPDQISRLSGRVEDAMANERWDIEFDFVYERNSVVDRFSVDLPTCDPATGATCSGSNWVIAVSPGFPAPLPPDVILDHNWKDSYSFRLGGSYSLLPGLAQVHLGLSYETKGIEDGYEQLDFLPFHRIGAGLGLSMRVGNLDVHLAYAHIHQLNVTVSDEDAQLAQVSAQYRYAELDCQEDLGRECTEEEVEPYATAAGPTAARGTTINAGRYTSNFDVISLGLTYHFR